jgi:hypothetical protein
MMEWWMNDPPLQWNSLYAINLAAAYGEGSWRTECTRDLSFERRCSRRT